MRWPGLRTFRSASPIQPASRWAGPFCARFCAPALRFMAANSFVDRDGVSAAEKIYCLKRYTTGCARECIDGHLSVFTAESYIAARNMLDTRFGNRFVVTFAFRDKLENWPKISSNDFRSLERFSDFLKEVQSNLSVLNTVDVLNDP